MTARKIFFHTLGVKHALWGGAFWGRGFYINTVSRHGNERIITEYVKNQGREDEYEVLHEDVQLKLF